MHTEVGQGAEGMGGSQKRHWPTSLHLLVSSHAISSTSIPCKIVMLRHQAKEPA